MGAIAGPADPITSSGPALADGSSIPWSWYTDPAVLVRERERLFHRSWQYVGRATQLGETGSFLTGRIAGVPILVVRSDEDRLAGFVNICRHRGAEVLLEPEGRRSSLQCHYHAWTYALDGTLRRAPRADREASFDASELSLRAIAVDTWGPFVFANLDVAAAPLADTLGDIPELVAASGIDVTKLRFHHRVEYEQGCNWKIAVENFLECYHCPLAHPGFSQAMDVTEDAYELQIHPTFAVQFGAVREGAQSAPYALAGKVAGGQYHLIWPSMKININPGRMNLSIGPLYPGGTDVTLATLDYFFGEEVEQPWIDDMLAFDDQVGSEDTALIESVQRGVAAGIHERGRLLQGSEALISAFQAYLVGELSR